MQRLRVSDNRRFLVTEDGTPFFYLGDTAWELFHRLSREDAEEYLQDRAGKKFTVIQAVALAEHEYHRPNFYGHHPLIDNDPDQPNEAYFEHVDWVVRRANALGLYVGLLPTWGDKWHIAWGGGPEIFTPENARAFGRWLGERYRDDGVIWILGGDRPVETDEHRAIIRATAQGVREGDGGAHLRTFHPPGGNTSSKYWPDEDWLDVHMWQSGHARNRANYHDITQDYTATPVKPVLDAEPGYEDHPAGFDLENGYLDHYDVRKAAYWAVFAGACGHTYGCHDIWQFLDPARWAPITMPRTPWREALRFPGSGQVQHLRTLIESRPVLRRIPDQSLLISDPGEGTHHVQATRDEQGTYAFVYLASGKPVTVDLAQLNGPRVEARWFCPRTALQLPIGTFDQAAPLTLTPPAHGPDWVLILDGGRS